MQLGKEMGLEGAKLLAFLENQQKLGEERRREEEKRRKEEEEKEERRRKEDEEREARRQERELRKLEMEAELLKQKEAMEAAKREHELELARLGQEPGLGDRVHNREDQANTPLLTAGMIWTHIFNTLRDLQPMPSGKRPVGLPS